MVIHDLDIVGVTRLPPKTNTPPFVDTDTVLTRSITSELLQSIARWHPKISNPLGCIEDQKFTKRDLLNGGSELPDVLPLEQAFRFAIAETLDHVE